MAIAEMLAGLPATISETVARNTKTAADWQDAKIKERDWQRQREAQFILSKYADPDGRISAEGQRAAMEHAIRADLLPEVQEGVEKRTNAALQSQIDAGRNRLVLKEMGLDPQLTASATDSAPVRVEAPQQERDTTGFTTPDMEAAAQPRARAEAPGEVRIPGAPEAMPAPTEATYRAPVGTYWSDAMREQPKDMMAAAGGAAGSAGDYEPGGAKYKTLDGKDPGAVAAARLKVEQNMGVPKGASLQEVEVAYNKFREVMYAPAVAGKMGIAAFYDPKTKTIDYAAWQKHQADIRTKAAEADAKLQGMGEEDVGKRRKETLEEQLAASTLTEAQNKAKLTNEERATIGRVVDRSNDVIGKAFGERLDAGTFADQKTAEDVTKKATAGALLVNSLGTPGFLVGDTHKVMAHFNAMANAIQVIEGIPATEAGHKALVYLGIPDMDLERAIAAGAVDPHGGLTGVGANVLAKYFTSTPAAQVKADLSDMIKHSILLHADIKNHIEKGKASTNYGVAVPQAGDKTFLTGTAMAGAPAKDETPAPAPTPKEPAKMTPAEGKAEKERRFQEGKRKKAAAAAKKSGKVIPKSQAELDALPVGTIYFDDAGNRYEKKAKKGGK